MVTVVFAFFIIMFFLGKKYDMKGGLNQNISGSAVYHTNSLILLVRNMLCSKLHFQQGFDLIPLSCEIAMKAMDGSSCGFGATEVAHG